MHTDFLIARFLFFRYPGFDSHWCATPTDPGVLCSTDADCKNRKWTTAVCDKVTNLCVTIREACQLP